MYYKVLIISICTLSLISFAYPHLPTDKYGIEKITLSATALSLGPKSNNYIYTLSYKHPYNIYLSIVNYNQENSAAISFRPFISKIRVINIGIQYYYNYDSGYTFIGTDRSLNFNTNLWGWDYNLETGAHFARSFGNWNNSEDEFTFFTVFAKFFYSLNNFTIRPYINLTHYVDKSYNTLGLGIMISYRLFLKKHKRKNY